MVFKGENVVGSEAVRVGGSWKRRKRSCGGLAGGVEQGETVRGAERKGWSVQRAEVVAWRLNGGAGGGAVGGLDDWQRMGLSARSIVAVEGKKVPV